MGKRNSHAITIPGAWECQCNAWNLPSMANCPKCGRASGQQSREEPPGNRGQGAGGKTPQNGWKSKGWPNKTEERWNRERLGGRGQYEKITFRLANGHKYTPDWYEPSDGLLPGTCYEIKGGHRFASHGRSRLAFDQARLEHPEFRWIWATWKGGEWLVETF